MRNEPLSGQEYDAQWKALGDFIRYNPGARHRRRLCLSLLEGLQATSVADIGCGPGELLLALRKAHAETARFVGADFAPETVEATQAALPWAKIHQLDITQTSLDESFDLVSCCEVIEHLEPQQEAIKNLARMVNPGGHMLVSCPTGTLFPTEQHFGHVRHPTAEDLETWGAQAGLQTLKSYRWGFPTYLALKHLVNLNPELSMKQFGAGDYNAVKKLINHVLYAGSFLSWPGSKRACQLVWLYQKPR